MTDADRRKWDARHQESGPTLLPARFLVSLADRLPRRGSALDLAGGSGANAIYLAQLGLDVTLCDISEVALSFAKQSAAQVGVSLHTVSCDLSQEAIPSGLWTLILVSHYLDRALYRQLPDALDDGGFLIIIQPTVRNLERHLHPARPYLLDDGELALFYQARSDLDILASHEGWNEDDRHLAAIFGQRKRRCHHEQTTDSSDVPVRLP